MAACHINVKHLNKYFGTGYTKKCLQIFSRSAHISNIHIENIYLFICPKMSHVLDMNKRISRWVCKLMSDSFPFWSNLHPFHKSHPVDSIMLLGMMADETITMFLKHRLLCWTNVHALQVSSPGHALCSFYGSVPASKCLRLAERIT